MAARVVGKLCRMRKSKMSGISCVLGPFWMLLLSTAEALVDVEHNWVETGKPQSSERQLWQASGSGSDCPQSSQYKWSHSSCKLWWPRYPKSAYTISFMIWIGIGAIRAHSLGQILAQGCKSDQIYLLFIWRREQQSTKRSCGRLSSLTWIILSVFLLKKL